MEVIEITTSQVGAVQKALKLLNLQYWSYSIHNHPLKKPISRIIFVPLRGSVTNQSTGLWSEWNLILGALES